LYALSLKLHNFFNYRCLFNIVNSLNRFKIHRYIQKFHSFHDAISILISMKAQHFIMIGFRVESEWKEQIIFLIRPGVFTCKLGISLYHFKVFLVVVAEIKSMLFQLLGLLFSFGGGIGWLVCFFTWGIIQFLFFFLLVVIRILWRNIRVLILFV